MTPRKIIHRMLFIFILAQAFKFGSKPAKDIGKDP